MKSRKCFLALLLCLLLLAGCTIAQTQYVNPIRFYYNRAEVAYNQPGGTLAYETRDLMSRQVGIDEILALYFAGPQDETLVSPFPGGTACTALSMQDGVLTLTLNDAYAQLTGAARTTAAACLTLTLTQIRTVEEVCLETPDAVSAEQRQVHYRASDFILRDASVTNPEWTATLYFCAAQSRQMRSEKRAVAYRTQSDLPQLVLEQLLDGPTLQNLVSPIPRGTRCVDVTLTDGVCSVVLSEEFTACDTDEASAALAVRALAATLCELPDVQSVRLSVIGVQDLTYFSIAEPLAPTDGWFT